MKVVQKLKFPNNSIIFTGTATLSRINTPDSASALYVVLILWF